VIRLLLCAALVATGCVEDLTPVDGSAPGQDMGAPDLGLSGDGGGPTFGAFTVVGCESLDVSGSTLRCSGGVPLHLQFVSLLDNASTLVWTFEGGNPASSSDASPTVLWTQPGSYAVQLAAAGPTGSSIALGAIVAAPGEAGALCVDDSDCDSAMSLTCRCTPDDGCAAGLTGGLCTKTCTGGSCGSTARCADLSPAHIPLPLAPVADAGLADGGVRNPLDGPFRDAICLPSCTTDSECRAGLICRDLPILKAGQPAGGTTQWQRACFADLLEDIGASCVDGAGSLDKTRCLSADCEALGARGMCSQPCATSQDCPSYAACATFGGGTSLCVARCDTRHTCTADPLLGCASPGGTGAWSFTTDDPTPSMYCAPRRCSMPSDCAPSGNCVAGFCQPL
jgi:hypothetical protein